LQEKRLLYLNGSFSVVDRPHMKSDLVFGKEYKTWLVDIKAKVRNAQIIVQQPVGQLKQRDAGQFAQQVVAQITRGAQQ
jgi:hypothetical protein